MTLIPRPHHKPKYTNQIMNLSTILGISGLLDKWFGVFYISTDNPAPNVNKQTGDN